MLERLPERIARKIAIDDETGCWQWIGAIDSRGYGNIWFNRAARVANRIVYELLVGPIPEGLELDHLCRNPPCVNPAHQDPVTRHENNARGFSPSAINLRKTQCIRGHEFTPENTYSKDGSRRHCRTCGRGYDAARRARRKAATS